VGSSAIRHVELTIMATAAEKSKLVKTTAVSK
jgi:hypothetical protein